MKNPLRIMIVDRRSCRMRAAFSMHPNKMYVDSGADTSSGLHQLRYGEKSSPPQIPLWAGFVGAAFSSWLARKASGIPIFRMWISF